MLFTGKLSGCYFISNDQSVNPLVLQSQKDTFLHQF